MLYDEKIILTPEELHYLRKKSEQKGAGNAVLCVFIASLIDILFIFIDIPKQELILLMSTVSICSAGIPVIFNK
jgi:hypothetical protein